MSKFIGMASVFIWAVSVLAQTPKDTIFYQDVSWSPDGTKLLLSRMDIKGNDFLYQIYEVDVDGLNYKKLTEGPQDVWTSCSPDGSKFLYSSKKDGNTDIWVRQFDSSNSIRLTTDTTRESHPDWSPDGGKITFILRKNGLSQVYTIDVNSSNIVALTNDSMRKDNPRWSPDGKRIAYYGNIEAGHDSIYIIDADGKNKFTLCKGIWPSWSHNGNRILFTYDDAIYQINLTDSVKTKIIDNAYFARWSPDGEKIAFIRRMWRAEKGWPVISAVYLINADGTGERRLTPE